MEKVELEFQTIMAHDAATCVGPCAIHAPSDHSMKDFPRLWRNDRRIMERICNCGIGHPDPDHMAFLKTKLSDEDYWAEGVHGCCGHCG